MDIQIIDNDNIFNYRVASIIRNGNKILVQKDSRVSYYALPGGRCKIGESSIVAIIREFKEETGIDVSFKKEIGILENFFTSSFNNKNYHEILIIHELEFDNKDIYNREIISNIEEKHKNQLSYVWLDINELQNENFKPKIIIDLLNKNDFFHYVNVD